MKPKQSLILMTVTLFLNITGHGWTEEKSTEQLAEIAQNQALMVMCLQ